VAHNPDAPARVTSWISQVLTASPGRIAIALVIVLVGCGGPNTPSAPTPPPAVAPPAPGPSGLQPTLTSVFPNVVSTAGSWGTVRGSQFEQGATLTFGASTFQALVIDSTEMRFPSSGPHVPGIVDVTVRNPGGLSATLPAAYTYAPPGGFDFNGDWIAHAGPDFEIDMRFTIHNNVLVSIECAATSQRVAIPLQIGNGSFSLAGDDVSLSGTILSATTSQGQVNAPGCGNAGWWADKAGSNQ